MRPGTDAGPDDRTLLQAHVDGDPDAFATLVRRHRDRLWAVALRTTGDPDDAADALQDALVSAYRRAGSYRGDAAVTTWLHRVVVNACLDRLRAERVRRAEPLPDDLDSARPTGPAGPAAAGRAAELDPEEQVARTEQRDQVLAALRQLPPEQRAALVLVDMEGWSVAEAAHALGCAEGTVKSRCARGRSRLAALLRPVLLDLDRAPAADAADAANASDATATRRTPRAAADGNRSGATAVPPRDPPRGPPDP